MNRKKSDPKEDKGKNSNNTPKKKSKWFIFNRCLQRHEVLAESILTLIAIFVATLLYYKTGEQVRVTRETLDSTKVQSDMSMRLSLINS